MGLDTVEIVMNLEEAFGIEIKDKEAEQLRTTRDIINFVCQKLNVSEATSGPCLSARAFYRLRESVIATSDIPRRDIRPGTPLRSRFSGYEGRERWAAVGQHMGFKAWPKLTFLGLPSGPGNFGHMAQWLVSGDPRRFIGSDATWTRPQIRQVVRSIIANIIGVTEFSDDALIVEELGAD
jgi:hypothetical protein